MTFASKPFHERLAVLGDEAEGEFERWANIERIGFERSGRRRPPFSMKKLHAYVRHEPDYLTEDAYYEVKGFGKEQVLKLRTDKLDALHYWDLIHPVRLWIWDSLNRRFVWWDLQSIDRLAEEAETGRFPENTHFYAIKAEVLFPEAPPDAA